MGSTWHVGSVVCCLPYSSDGMTDVVHKSLRECERHLRSVHPDCAVLAPGALGCACGRTFEHVCEDGGCYWKLREGLP